MAIIGQVGEEEDISIIGVSSVPSHGIKRGVVVDIDKAVESISESLEAAERMAGTATASVLITIGGTHISCVNSPGVVAVASPDVGIMQSDVDRVTEAARAISIPSSREIVHVIPRTYNVDSQEGVLDPVGMSGVRLQVETHIISASTTSLRNLVKCVQQVGLDVQDVVFTGLASAEAVLSETEKELGVVLVDIGGGTTSIIVFMEGSPIYSSVIPIGGQNITNDIAIGLRMSSLEDAERLKTYLSSYQEPVMPEGEAKEDPVEEIDVSSLNIEGLNTVNREFLIKGIVQPRLEEIFDLVKEELKKGGFEETLPAGMVMSGGGALTVGLEEVAKKRLKVPIRIGEPAGVSGLIEEISTPAYSSAIGMLKFAAHRLPLRRVPFIGRFSGLDKQLKKLVGWFRDFLP